MLTTFSFVGGFVFALSGALAAVRIRLDLFGVLVVGVVTAIGGGLLRDVLLGATPPMALHSWPAVAVPAVASLCVFWWHPHISRLRGPVLLLDAAGLGLFTAVGTMQALQAGLGAVGASILGVLSGVGGGVLLREIPIVLSRDVYAVAALAGALALCLVQLVQPNTSSALLISATVTIGLRVVALWRNWSIPRPRNGFTIEEGNLP